MTAEERDAWLEPGERVLIDTRIVPAKQKGERCVAPVLAKKAEQILVVATDRRIRIGDQTFVYRDMMPMDGQVLTKFVKKSSTTPTATGVRINLGPPQMKMVVTGRVFTFEDKHGRRVILPLHADHGLKGNQANNCFLASALGPLGGVIEKVQESEKESPLPQAAPGADEGVAQVGTELAGLPGPDTADSSPLCSDGQQHKEGYVVKRPDGTTHCRKCGANF
jgi:hypothetical protein